MPRYEFVEGTSSKFWDITQKGASLVIKFGKIGSAGQTQLKELGSESAAKAEYDKLIASKVKKGYAPAGAPAEKPAKSAPKKSAKQATAPAAAASQSGGRRYEFVEGGSSKFWEIKVEGSGVVTVYGRIGANGASTLKEYGSPAEAKKEYDKLISSKEKKGYRLVSEGSAAAAPKVKAAASPDLEAQIRKNPDDDDAYLVYADWLQAQGDPRGELITVQHRLAASPKDKALKKAETDLLKAYGEHFLPKKFAEMMGAKKERYLNDGRCEVSWRNGFVRGARVGRENEDDSPYPLQELVTELLGHPSAKFLRELTIGSLGIYDEYDFGVVVKAIIKAKPAGVRTLFLADYSSEYSELSWSHLGDLSKLWEAMPALEELTLRSGSMKLGAISLPQLRSLKIITGGLDKKNVQAICAAKWPSLESLHLYFGTDNYGGNCSIKDVAPILEGTSFPKVKHLGLMNSELTDKICAALPGAKILARLETLDLSLGTMSDAGAAALAENRAAFKKLKKLDVSQNFLTKKGVAQIKDLCGDVTAGSQKEPYDWGENDDENRYVSVGE